MNRTFFKIQPSLFLVQNVNMRNVPLKITCRKFSRVGTDSSRIRNIGIIAHIDAGKTTTTERILYHAGMIKHIGNVDDGDTITDYMQQERERGITITSAAVSFLWKKFKINLIDTPGHVDFTLEVERSLRVLDGAIAVIDASAGVEAQTLTVWSQANKYKIPRIVFINKMDKKNADFEESVQSLIDKLKCVPLLIQIPLDSGPQFSSILDLISLSKITWCKKSKESSGNFNVIKFDDFSTKEKLMVSEGRSNLIGILADYEDEIADCILNDMNVLDIPSKLINRSVRKSTLNLEIVPILCGSSFRNIGVQPLLDAICNYLPHPFDIKDDVMQIYDNQLCAFAFKTIHDKQRGPLTFARVYSGTLQSNVNVFNVNQAQSDKISNIMQMFADDYQDLTSIQAGDICALSGLKCTITGDTLLASKSAAKVAQSKYAQLLNLYPDDPSTVPILPGLSVPEPVFFCSVETSSPLEEQSLVAALDCITKEDPSVHVRYDEESRQTIVAGMGELHLEILHKRLIDEYKIDAYMGKIQITYRETITCSSVYECNFEKVINDKNQMVQVKLSVHSYPNGGVPSKITISSDPKDNLKSRLKRFHIIAIENGMKSALSRGPLVGNQVSDISIELHDLVIGRGTIVPMISASVSFAVSEAIKKASPVLQEPIALIKVITDSLHQGTVMTDMSHRRGYIINVQMKDDQRIVIAEVPLSELLGYSTQLRTKTSGTAHYTLEISSYKNLNSTEQQNVINELTGFIVR